MQVRPSREEQDLIAQLLRAVTKSVECREFFDVYDELDAEEEGVEFKPSICARNVRRGKEAYIAPQVCCYATQPVLTQSATLMTWLDGTEMLATHSCALRHAPTCQSS